MITGTAEDIKQAIRKDNPSIDKLESMFPDVDRWTLRRLRAEYLRSLSTQEVTKERLITGETIELPKAAHEAIRAGFFRPVVVNITEVPKSKPLFKKAGEEWLIISDLHAPKHDPKALDVVLQISQSIKLDGIVINGDAFDVHALSRYTPSAERAFRWVDERTEALQPLALLRAVHPKLRIIFKPGNHDERPDKFLASTAPQLQGLFSLEQLLGLDSLGFEWHEGPLLMANDSLMIKHGTVVRKNAGYSVTAEVNKAGMSVIMGHTHRRSLIEVTHAVHRAQGIAPSIGVELGCLCELRADYLPVEECADWQQGCALVTVYDDKDFDVELIRIFNGTAHFRGVRFESRL